MNRHLFWAAVLLLLWPASARAEQDFYGIQMRNDVWAQNLVWQGPPGDPKDLIDGPVLSHGLRGEASLKEVGDERIDFRVTIFNDSGKPVPTDPTLRDFIVYTRDGKKYPLIDKEDSAPTYIDPK